MTIERTSVDEIGSTLFQVIARNFPVAAASDEFYYFPQVSLKRAQKIVWDNFSEETIAAVVKQLSDAEKELDTLARHDPESGSLDSGMHVDLSLLQKRTRALMEQLTEVRAWAFQPTFHLTIACIGLAQAIRSNHSAAKHDQARRLPAFFAQAAQALKRVPTLFRDLGLEMVVDTRKYMQLLKQQLPELKSALAALDRFEQTLRKIPTRDNFLLPKELIKRIIRFHLNCGMDFQELDYELDQEIHEMRTFIKKMTGNPSSDLCWEKIFNDIPRPEVGRDGLIGLYRKEVDQLAQHCLNKGFISSALYYTCPVRVEPVPAFLSATRTASSYSIPPQHPPTGGVFYVINANVPGEHQKGYQREFRILCAHETYPGHHLLDSSRWSLTRPIRRAIEQPIFYEGWACFAEELLRLTGYLDRPGDPVLLARRRLWRAVRGKVDLGLQTGALDIPTAARYLTQTGMRMEDALSVVRKYPLNPGYQLCYTIGLRRFIDLFHRYGQSNLQQFVRIVLGQGEIDFQDLERILQYKCA
jgi:uncharacterized protein (DUF885 family)